MHTHRFGRKLKLPSTIAIKHEILRMMLQDEIKAQAAAESHEELVAQRLSAAEELSSIDTHAETQISLSERVTGSSPSPT